MRRTQVGLEERIHHRFLCSGKIGSTLMDACIVFVLALMHVHVSNEAALRVIQHKEVNTALVRFIFVVLTNRTEARPACHTAFIKGHVCPHVKCRKRRSIQLI